MRNFTLAMLLGLGCVTTAAVAADEQRSPYVAGLVTGIKPSSARDPDFGIGGMGIFGYPLGDAFNLEVTAFGNILRPNANNIPGNNNDYQIGLGLDAMLPLTEGTIQPFLVAGGGAILERAANVIKTGREFSPYLDAGGGLLVNFTKQISMRLDARWLLDFNDEFYANRDQLSDYRFSIGLQYAFFVPKPAPVVLPPPPPPVAPLPPAPIDGDDDGDGVPNSRDKCPGTPKGFKVDADGCIIEQTIILRTVNFEFNKATLTPEAKDALEQVYAGMASQSKLTVEIGGHTDSIGSDAYNKKLSQRRADSVRTYLISKGIDGSRMAAVGYGEGKPVASNADEAGRAENRRVEFNVLNKPLEVKVVKKPSNATKPRKNKK